jgi:hypothetical protein
MMARRQVGELRLPDEPGVWHAAVVFMSAGCHEAPTFGRPDRQLPSDQQPEHRV